jgi:hypothetical protein
MQRARLHERTKGRACHASSLGEGPLQELDVHYMRKEEARAMQRARLHERTKRRACHASALGEDPLEELDVHYMRKEEARRRKFSCEECHDKVLRGVSPKQGHGCFPT